MHAITDLDYGLLAFFSNETFMSIDISHVLVNNTELVCLVINDLDHG